MSKRDGWIRVSKAHPCPVCGKPDNCTVSDNGAFAWCGRVSDGSIRSNSGGQFLHKVGDAPVAPVVRKRQPVKPEPAADAIGIAMAYTRALTREMIDAEAAKLGVSVQSLRRLRMGWAVGHGAFSFPMRDGAGKVIGVRLRATDGAKWTVTDTCNGLFIPADLTGEGPLLAVEGPTDTAALLDLGFDAIGRPSNSGGADLLVEYLRTHPRDLVIVADNDEPKERPDGTIYFPGHDGAESLAAAVLAAGVALSVRVISPPKAKDVRAWFKAGCTRAAVVALIESRAALATAI